MGMFNLNQNASLGLIGGNSIVSVTDDILINDQPSVLAAQPGTLTTRTNNTSGSLTMTNSGHGIVTGQRVDLYWAGGQCYGAVVGTVSGTTVPIASVSGGSNLPIATTAITVGIPTQRLIAVTGNNLSALLLACTVSAYVVFDSSAPADLAAMYLTAGVAYNWFTGNGITNPLAGVVVASVWVSHSSIAGALQVNTGVLCH